MLRNVAGEQCFVCQVERWDKERSGLTCLLMPEIELVLLFPPVAEEAQGCPFCTR